MKQSKLSLNTYTSDDVTIIILHNVVYELKGTRAGQRINRIGTIRNDKFTIDTHKSANIFMIVKLVRQIIDDAISENPILHQSYINDAGYMRTWEEKRVAKVEIGFECNPSFETQVINHFK